MKTARKVQVGSAVNKVKCRRRELTAGIFENVSEKSALARTSTSRTFDDFNFFFAAFPSSRSSKTNDGKSRTFVILAMQSSTKASLS